MHWIDLSIMGAYTFGIVAIGILVAGGRRTPPTTSSRAGR